MYCADIVAMPGYILGNSTYICHLDKKNGGRQVTEKLFTSKPKKGDVGMDKCFSKKYGNKGRAFNYLHSE